MTLEWEIIKLFSETNTPCFSYEDVKERFPGKNTSYLAQVLSKMVKTGKLIKLQRGTYCIVPLDQPGRNFIPNWHLVAKYLMKGKNYYIGYFSALQIHKLITQPSVTEIIVTDTQIKPNIQEIQGIRFQFVYHNQKRFFGAKKTWIDDYNKVLVSDIEKTLVDSFINPQYSGGIIEIAKAVYESKSQINQDKLFSYFTRSGSKVAARRYVFICDLLEIADVHHYELLQNNQSGSFLKLDPSLSEEGKINTKFGLIINREVDTIKQSIFT